MFVLFIEMTGLHPTVWGPSQWSVLHYMATAYPVEPTPERKRSMLDYITSMCSNLPCDACSVHCKQYLHVHPPKVESSASLFTYLVDFHNAVNQRLHKRLYTEKEVRDQIANRARAMKPSNAYRLTMVYGLGGLGLLLVCMGVAIYAYFRMSCQL